MQKYSEFAPTGFDTRGLNLPDRQEWIVAPCTQNRDSEPYTQSNFAACLSMLGGESDTVEVHSFNHWACGWFEIIIVHQSRAGELEDIEKRLEDYPLLDEEDASNREYESYCESWNDWACGDFRRAMVREFGLQDVTEDFLADADSERLREWYGDHAPEPYFCESSGVCIPVDRFVQRMDRSDMAALLRFLRRKA